MTETKSQITGFSFEAFDGNVTTWSRWVRRFETALDLFSCDTSKKRTFLLHFMGAGTYDVLCDKLLPNTPETKTYEELVKILTDHFDPLPNEILENYRFHLRKQKEEESCTDYVVALRKLSANCNFGNYLDTALRNQFVFGLKNHKIQSRLLEKQKLTLEDAINTAKTYELAEKGGLELHQHESKEGAVDLIGDKKKMHKMQLAGKKEEADRKCYRCGSLGHLANKCSHKDTVCGFCKGKGHLRRVCLKAKRQVHQIMNEEAETDEEMNNHRVEELMQIFEGRVKCIASHRVNRSKIFCKLQVNNVPLCFEIDTGAPVTIVSVADAKRHFGKSIIHTNDIALYSYCNTPLDCVGYILVQVKTPTPSPPVKLYIVRSGRKPLLGREWLRTISLNWGQIVSEQLQQVPPGQQSKDCVNEVSIGNRPNNLKNIIHQYPILFSTSTGKITGYQARIHVKEQATPKFFKARRIPFPLLEAVEVELEKQVSEGLLTPVNTSEWATPIVVVPKKNRQVRLCGDYKITLNPALKIDEYPLPTVDELFSTMAGGTKFTKIDLSKAYLQLEVHPDDRHLLTLNTHKGLFEPTRLMFGIACAPAKWQQFMEQLLSGIPGTAVFLDDIRITAKTDLEHFTRINEVLKRLNNHNMRVNLEKSEWMKDQIEYCGYVINKFGIQKMESKINAILEMKEPSNKDEVRALVGLINYYGRFVRNLSTILYPINKLLQKNEPFVWNAQCKKSFVEIKNQMQSNTILAHYDAKLPLVLAVDASPYGVGAVLSHEYPDGSEKPIQFASQTLSTVQRRYCHIDKEAYAIIYGVRKFYQYLYGRKFTLVTDNKPLAQIFSPHKGLPRLSATRMQHYAIFLGSFDYEIRVKKSKDNANADAFSRLPSSDKYKDVEEVDIFEIEVIQNLPVTVVELRKYTEQDKEVRVLLEALKYGRECEAKYRFGVSQSEFTLQQGCLIRGIRVYIPKALRSRILKELHSAHFGITKMKALARGYCWWQAMDKEIENLVLNCTECQSVRPMPVKTTPIHSWNVAKKPFERVHADFAGPFLGKYLFVMVDAYSKWPEVHVMKNITTESTIQVCREIFARMGTPNIFVSDHGTQFKSKEFQNFLLNNGIQHKLGAPYHPATNGLAERFVQTIKNKLKTTKCTANNLKNEISKILLAYRRAIHATSGKSPAILIFGRQIQSRLDLIIPKEQTSSEHKLPKKQFSEGERVAARDYITENKWQFGRIVRKIGDLHYEIKLDDHRVWKRHIDQIRKIGDELTTDPLEMLKTPDMKQTLTEMECPTESAEAESDRSIGRERMEGSKGEDGDLSECPVKHGNAEIVSGQMGDENPGGEQQIRRSNRVVKPPNRLNL